MTAEDAYIAMGCPGNEAAATKQNIRKKARAMVAEARAEAGEPAAQSAKRGSAAPAKPAASKRKRGAPDPEPIEQEHDDVADDMDDLAYDDGEQSVCTLELVGLPETVLSTIIAFAVELSFTSYSERQQRISAVRRVAHAWNHEMLQQHATQLWTKLTTPIPRHQFALFSLCSMLVSLCTNWPAVDAAWSTAAAELARSVSTPDRATRTPKAEKLLNNPELADLINDGGGTSRCTSTRWRCSTPAQALRWHVHWQVAMLHRVHWAPILTCQPPISMQFPEFELEFQRSSVHTRRNAKPILRKITNSWSSWVSVDMTYDVPLHSVLCRRGCKYVENLRFSWDVLSARCLPRVGPSDG